MCSFKILVSSHTCALSVDFSQFTQFAYNMMSRLFQMLRDAKEVLPVEGTKKNTQDRGTTTSDFVLPDFKIHELTHLKVLNAIDMEDCVRYGRLYGELMVCYVNHMSLPDIRYMRMHKVYCNLWMPMRKFEAIKARVQSHKHKMVLSVLHDNDDTIIMFVYDAEAERFRDEEEHYALVNYRKRAACSEMGLSKKKQKMSTTTNTIATQTDFFEQYNICNKPVNVYKSLINREIHGRANTTNIVLSLPKYAKHLDNNIIEEDDHSDDEDTLGDDNFVTDKRGTLHENQVRLCKIYYKTKKASYNNLYHLYTCCVVCKFVFLTSSLSSYCSTCMKLKYYV